MANNIAKGLGIFNTNLIKLLTHKMSYLQASAFETSRNVSAADIPGVRRREVKPFDKVIKKTAHGIEIHLSQSDVTNTHEHINREGEVLNLQNIAMEYQSLIHVYRRYHEMIRLVIGRG
ncbi:MAG: hypothetical protein K2X98_03005 [Alphaproteobacteria bacterium]|nr:hypothetical protein [Alphaproteobacteria bacterium]